MDSNNIVPQAPPGKDTVPPQADSTVVATQENAPQTTRASQQQTPRTSQQMTRMQTAATANVLELDSSDEVANQTGSAPLAVNKLASGDIQVKPSGGRFYALFSNMSNASMPSNGKSFFTSSQATGTTRATDTANCTPDSGATAAERRGVTPGVGSDNMKFKIHIPVGHGVGSDSLTVLTDPNNDTGTESKTTSKINSKELFVKPNSVSENWTTELNSKTLQKELSQFQQHSSQVSFLNAPSHQFTDKHSKQLSLFTPERSRLGPSSGFFKQKVFQKYPGESFDAIDENGLVIQRGNHATWHLRVFGLYVILALPYTLGIIVETIFVAPGYRNCNLGNEYCELEWTLSTVFYGLWSAIPLVPQQIYCDVEKLNWWTLKFVFIRVALPGMLLQLLMINTLPLIFDTTKQNLIVLFGLWVRCLQTAFQGFEEGSRNQLGYDDWWDFRCRNNDPEGDARLAAQKIQLSTTPTIPQTGTPQTGSSPNSSGPNNNSNTLAVKDTSQVAGNTLAVTPSQTAGFNQTPSQVSRFNQSPKLETGKELKKGENLKALVRNNQMMFLGSMGLMIYTGMDLGFISTGVWGDFLKAIRPALFFTLKRCCYLMHIYCQNQLPKFGCETSKIGYAKFYNGPWIQLIMGMATCLSALNCSSREAFALFYLCDMLAFGNRVFAFSDIGGANGASKAGTTSQAIASGKNSGKVGQWLSWYRAQLLWGKPRAVGRMKQYELLGYDLIMEGVSLQLSYLMILMVYRFLSLVMIALSFLIDGLSYLVHRNC